MRGIATLIAGEQSDGSIIDAAAFVYPGCTARQINAQLRHISPTDVMVLAAGTNNISKQSIPECKEEIRQTLDNAARKWKDTHVIMCCIPERNGKPELNRKIDVINSYISQEVAKCKDWHLYEHDVMEGDLRDGLHFSDQGQCKYALGIRHLVRSITSR